LFGIEALYTRGMIVHTYFDKHTHDQAELAFVNGIKQYDKKKGWRGPVAQMDDLENWQMRLPVIKKSIELKQPEHAVVLQVNATSLSIGLRNKGIGMVPSSDLKWIHKSGKSFNIQSYFKVGDVILVKHLHDEVYALDQAPEVEGAMIVMEPNTGRVFSVIGGYDRESYFNRALQAKRQSGSAFKPFVYLTALANGYEMDSILLDDHISIYQGPNMPKWEPKNFEGNFLGPITLRRAFEKSRNIPTIRIIMDLGVDKILETAAKFKLHSDALHKNYARTRCDYQ
jgi:penicillin-binding protein 1A